MSSDQRRALAATTPTTEVIKDAVTFPRERLGEPLDISPERFEAWLARVRRDAQREAAKMIRDACDRWKVDGDDERLVNEVLDPWTSRTLTPEETP